MYDLSGGEVDWLELQCLVLNVNSLAWAVFGCATMLLNRKKREFPANIPGMIMFVCIFFHLVLLGGVFLGFDELRKEDVACRMQSFMLVYLSQCILYLVTTMNINLFYTIVHSDGEVVARNSRKFLALILFMPIVNAILGSPGFGEEVTFCWIPLEDSWVWLLIANIGPSAICNIIGLYMWLSICRRIYAIYKEKINITLDGELTLFTSWAGRFLRQLFWIFINMYFSSYLFVGFVLFSVLGRTSHFWYHVGLDAGLGSIGFWCTVILLLTKENLALWRDKIGQWNRRCCGGSGGSEQGDIGLTGDDDDGDITQSLFTEDTRFASGVSYKGYSGHAGTPIN